ncbi:hypothetical protein GLS40_14215 [Pseudooceanicola sp. 216_PA32_1]|uniref:Uncharacterized protein n=1 Tax=Pseudooceanicola pacificus TaxID=2676438 RepID=A0A844W8H7_9RHOB|nr:hypothetical protein [Pseudooceanicola pacificus]MWB79191.1 hypothetical protein [Pseudooceanicola pacificus]
MHKAIAVVNVVAWSGFWAFGYLALSAHVEDAGQMVTATLLAALGGAIGLWAHLRLVRPSEQTGYAVAPIRGLPTFEDNKGEGV